MDFSAWLREKRLLSQADPEDELHVARVVPAVQMGRLREVRVAAEKDLTEASLAAEGDSPVEIDGGMLVAGPVGGRKLRRCSRRLRLQSPDDAAALHRP
jgi:hypothetical protein